MRRRAVDERLIFPNFAVMVATKPQIEDPVRRAVRARRVDLISLNRPSEPLTLSVASMTRNVPTTSARPIPSSPEEYSLTMPFSFEVELGNVTPDQVRAVWQEVLGDATNPKSDVARFLSSRGIDADELGLQSVDVEERSGDFGASILISILVPIAADVGKSLWEDYVRPRLRKKFNGDTGDEVS